MEPCTNLSRRTLLGLLGGIPLAGVAGPQCFSAPAATGWTKEWDRAVIAAAVARSDASFDPAEAMLRRRVGSAYNYHSALRDIDAHPTRDSLDYALILLETGESERSARAFRIIERLVSLQVVNPSSRWYGLWGYYLEEPPEKMAPADWNWADFNASTLLLILHRHGTRLPDALRYQVTESLRHAAASVRRRNVKMAYTNIAAMGTFVTFSAAEVLDDRDLLAYASDRVRRFAEEIDATGSFGEYNSPTYANVTLAQLTCFRMFVKNPEAGAVMKGAHGRLWHHLAAHWHAPTRQLAGPISRCYATVLSDPLWLQKSLDNKLEFLTLDQIQQARRGADAKVAILDWECPPGFRDRFLRLDKPRQHREIFFLDQSPCEPGGDEPRPAGSGDHVPHLGSV